MFCERSFLLCAGSHIIMTGFGGGIFLWGSLNFVTLASSTDSPKIGSRERRHTRKMLDAPCIEGGGVRLCDGVG